MNFIELQKMIGNDLNVDNLKLQEKLYKNTIIIREEILPVFNFKEFKKKDDSIEYTLALIFNKLYVMLVSTENIILLNDGWLAMYICRYNYELFIKTKYLLNNNSHEDVKARIKKFLEVGRWDTIKEKLDGIENNDEFIKDIKNNHKDFYRKMNSIVHPNIESLNLHINKNSDDLFNFMSTNIKFNWLITYKIIETIFNKKGELKFSQYPDLQKIKNIIDKY